MRKLTTKVNDFVSQLAVFRTLTDVLEEVRPPLCMVLTSLTSILDIKLETARKVEDKKVSF